jgi:hypothetical protein
MTAPLALSLLACAGATPANGDGLPAATSTAAPSVTTEATMADPTPIPPAPKVPSARVAAIEPARDGSMSMRAKILFKNPTEHTCRFLGYRLTWGASSKEVKLDTLVIPPGENRERWLKVHPEDGDLSDLTELKTLVQVETDCSAP